MQQLSRRVSSAFSRSVIWLLSGLILLTVACSSGGIKKSTGTDADAARLALFSPKLAGGQSDPVTFQIKVAPGRIETSRYQSQSLIRKYEGTQILSEKTELSDFTTRLVTKKVEAAGNIVYTFETIAKDGNIDLHANAYPELGEVMDYVLSSRADVIRAGTNPKDGIFFVPPISFPKKPVKVGDTWKFNYKWKAAKNGLMLELDMVSIFKNKYECPNKDVCAEIETSGTIAPAKETPADVQIELNVRARMLIAIGTGSVVWSDVRTTKNQSGGNLRVEVLSCIESILDGPESERWLWRQQPKCDSAESLPASVPGV